MNYNSRVIIADKIENEIKNMLDIYYEMGNVDQNYLYIYPLMHLEEYYYNQVGSDINGMEEAKLISWLLGEMLKRGAKFKKTNSFDESNYKDFNDRLVWTLRIMYMRYITLDEIKDTYSILSTRIRKLDKKYLLEKAFPKDKYDKGEIYYNQFFDKV